MVRPVDNITNSGTETNYITEYSNIILTIQISWNLFITIIAYTRSWEGYFLLFPSAWKIVYKIIINNPFLLF